MKWKRTARNTILLLLLGAILNIAVAWGCILLFPPFYLNPAGFIGERELSVVEAIALVKHWFPHLSEHESAPYASTHGDFGWRHTSFTATNEQGDILSATEKLAGWPLFCTSGWHMFDSSKSPELQFTSCFVEVPQSWRAKYYYWRLIRFLPCIPLWPGFAINTIFYAAILWMVFFIPGKVKRALRRRRGLCPACAYPVGTSPVCTECGRPFHARIETCE